MTTNQANSDDGTLQIGDRLSGFSMEYDVLTQTLRVVAWGFWTSDVAKRFGPVIADECTRRLPAAAVFDMSALMPMREEGQEGWVQLMTRFASRVGVTVLTRSKLTRLQLQRLSKGLVSDANLDLRWVEPREGGV